MVSVLEDKHIMQGDLGHHKYDVMSDHIDLLIGQRNLSSFRIVYNNKKIQICGMNMIFISSDEAKNSAFHLWLYGHS